MGDICADTHGWKLEDSSRALSLRSNSACSDTSELCVELHADIRDVLSLALHDVSVLHTLTDNPVAALARLLDAAVITGILVRKDEDQDLRTSLGGRSGLVPNLSYCRSCVWSRCQVESWRLGLDFAAVCLVDTNKLRDELADNVLVGSTLTALNNTHTPGLERGWVSDKELLALEIPTTRCTRLGYAASKLHFGCLEEATLDDDLVGVDSHAVALEVWVRAPRHHVKAVLNCLPALLRRCDSKLDHLGCLTLIELVDISLVFLEL